MTKSAIVYTNFSTGLEAGKDLGLQITYMLSSSPDVVILFAASHYEHRDLLQALKRTCHPRLLVGCSSAGEFTSAIYGEGLACAVAISSTDIQFTATIGRQIHTNIQQAATTMAAGFRGNQLEAYPYRSVLMLTDALAGHTDDLIDKLTWLTSGSYQFFGGGAGDDSQFLYTPVFYDTEVVTDTAVALEICSKKPAGLGSSHGWKPISAPIEVTASDGMLVTSLDGKSPLKVFQDHALATGQNLDITDPLPFFLHNVIGIDMGIGYKLRVPLSLTADGAILYAAEVPSGATICIMGSTVQSAAEAAETAARDALRKLSGENASVAFFFDCVATRLKMGKEFGFELAKVQEVLSPMRYIGCNTHGQIVRADGQFSGFHNCTAVVFLLPE
jgi:hypothetical protein